MLKGKLTRPILFCSSLFFLVRVGTTYLAGLVRVDTTYLAGHDHRANRMSGTAGASQEREQSIRIANASRRMIITKGLMR